MAVVNTKSVAVTANDASPPTLAPSHISGGALRECVGYVETAAADDNDSLYRVCRVPSNGRLSQLLVKHDQIAGMDDVNIGLYRTAADGAAVASENCIADDIDFAAAARDVYTDVSEIVEEDGEKRFWELAGATSDPKCHYDVVLKAVAAASAAGTIAVMVRYVI